MYPLLFLLISAIFIFFPLSSSMPEYDYRYSNCTPSQFSCGDLPNLISFPFRGNGRQSFCGYPGFDLECTENQKATITLENQVYDVLDISIDKRHMKIVQDGLSEDTICATSGGVLANTTFNYNIFSYPSDYTNLTLFFGCTNNSSAFLPINGNLKQAQVGDVTCHLDGGGGFVPFTVGFSQVQAEEHAIKGGCNKIVIVPVLYADVQVILGNSSALGRILVRGFVLQWSNRLVDDYDCKICMKSGGTCGYNATFGIVTCFCTDQAHDYVCPPEGNNEMVVRIIIAVGSFSLSMCIMVAILMWNFTRISSPNELMAFWKERTRQNQNLEVFLRNYGSLAPQRYNYSEIKKMTSSFKENLGQGGFGSVFKGKLADGRLVAVKVLKASKGNGEEFINEIVSIGRTSHLHVVTFLGFCLDGSKRALIYEFMSNGSLEKFIYNQKSAKSNPHLGWDRLYQIAVGIAKGLEYLHGGCNTRIVHFDIKPHNILLDENFCPKISDFGLAKLCHQKDSIISMAELRGTIGYIAPEVFSRNFGGVSSKSDVYSYGMMILEMVGGRKNFDKEVDRTSEHYFPDWIYEHIGQNEYLKLDADIREEEEHTIRKMIIVGLWCIQMDPTNRPSIGKVLDMLEGNLESLPMPPKPFLYSPPRQLAEFSSISTWVGIRFP